MCVCVHVTQNLVLGCPDSFQLPPCFARPWRLSELGPAHHARAVLAGRLGPDHQQEVLRGGRFSALGGVGDMFQHVSTSGGEKHGISGCFSWLHVFVWKCSRGCKRKMLCYCSNDCIMMICEYLYDVRVCVCVCLSVYLSICLSLCLCMLFLWE